MKKIKIYHNEIWKKIYYNGTKTMYSVSNKGRIKNRHTEKILKYGHNQGGYCRVCLMIRNKPNYVLVHRIVASAFIPNPENKPQVNHKDGNKNNNKANNLEWNTAQENIIHLFKVLGHQNKKGEECHFNVYSEELIRKICELLQEGYSNKEIRNLLSIKGDKYRCLIRAIEKRKNWKNISKDYIFPEKDDNELYIDEIIHFICSQIEKGMSNTDIAKSLINKFTKLKNANIENLRDNIIGRIRRGETHKKISKKYNFPEIINNSDNYAVEHIHFICKELEKGKSNVEIAKKFMKKYDDFDNYKKLLRHIGKIKRKERWKHISKDYDF